MLISSLADPVHLASEIPKNPGGLETLAEVVNVFIKVVVFLFTSHYGNGCQLPVFPKEMDFNGS